MWVIRTITARTFLWLAAMAIPFQGLPSATCGCDSVDRWIETSSCCQQELACCSSEISPESGCQCSTGCQCGDNCQCSVSSHAPSEPVIPPFENNSPERILADSIGSASLVTLRLPSATRQHTDSYVRANARTALDCCVALCRFTLWAFSCGASAHFVFRASLCVVVSFVRSSLPTALTGRLSLSKRVC